MARLRARPALIGLALMALLFATSACVPGRPSQIVEADVVGIVRTPAHPVDADMTVELMDGTILQVPRSAVEFDGPGISAGRLLLYGHDRNRVWYASLVLQDQAAFDECYEIDGILYGESESVVVLSAAWRGVGLRSAKRAGFEVSSDLVDENALYRAGGEDPDVGFCVDVDGLVLGLG